MSGPAVRLAHLSDVHLGPITGFRPRYWNLKRATGYANWIKNRRDAYRRDALDRIIADVHAVAPDHICVTGDLCNIGLPAEFDAALRWLQSVGTPARVSVIPGNHDIYTRLGHDPGVTRWAAYMSGDAASLPGSGFPYLRRVGPVALIGLNSAVETAPFIAAGELGSAQRARLAAMLEATAAEGLFRLVMIHHPPLPGQTRRSHGLNDAAALRDLLARHGADLVIHGHLHRNVRASVARHNGNGSVPVLGVPSAALGRPHKAEPLARYNLLTIEAGRVTVVGRGLATPDGGVVELDRFVIEPKG